MFIQISDFFQHVLSYWDEKAGTVITN